MVLVINDLMREIGFEKFKVRLNNRKVLNGLLEKAGLSEQSVAVLRSLDKLPKIGADKVANEIAETTSASQQQIGQILELAKLTGSNLQMIEQLKPLCAGNPLAEEGCAQIEELVSAVQPLGLGDDHLEIDVSIARGLDYYTGTIVETFLEDLPQWGSVCSGGRYDNLAQLYSKTELPGIGASLGLDRLLAAMGELKMIPEVRTTADVLIIQFDSDQLGRYLQIASQIRSAGIGVEIFPSAKKLKQQFKYADKRGFPIVVIAGSDELESNSVKVKWMDTGKEESISIENESAALIQLIQDRN
ncbi:MAG: HisS family protein, partial [Planctomycetota bacterium]